jgi:hypothetical protein
MLSIFSTWCEFFSDRDSITLGKEEVQGLFGELTYLYSLSATANPRTINDVLSSWMGPYDRGQDFHLPDRYVEVKTKNILQNEVKISSEFQLRPESGKELNLVVYSVESSSSEASTIRDLFIQLREQVAALQGDLSILLRALGKAGLTPDNLQLYDNWRFIPRQRQVYNCNNDDFPKLIPENVSPKIKRIRYTLSLAGLEHFITDSEKY